VREIFRVEITTTAEQDIEEIWEYMAGDNPENALSFISNLEMQIVTLESYPFRCPIVPENEVLGTSFVNCYFADNGLFLGL
jgi:plasmid stabilization system protein ParE